MNVLRDIQARITMARDALTDGDLVYAAELLRDLDDDLQRLIVERVVANRDTGVGDL